MTPPLAETTDDASEVAGDDVPSTDTRSDAPPGRGETSAGVATTTAAGADDESRDRPRASTVASTTAIAFAVGAAAIDATYAVPLLLLGGAGMAVGVVKRRRALLDYATAGALGGVLLHGAMGGSPLGAVAAAGLLVFAWDQADHAFGLDAHLGTDASVTRGEVAHALYSFAVMAVAGGGAVALALVASGRRPLPALVLLLLGAVLLTAAVRDR